MATEVVYQIGPGHKRPGYATVSAWMWDTAIDLVSSGVIIVGELVETGTFYNQDYLTITDATVDEDNYRVLRPHPSVRHTGKKGTGAGLYNTLGGWGSVLDIQESYFRLEDLEIWSNGDGIQNGILINAAASGIRLTNLIISDCPYAGITSNGAAPILIDNCIIHHCAVIGGAGGILGDSGDTDATTCRHCTVFRNDDADNIAVTAIRYCTVQNCASFNYGGSAGHKDYLNVGAGSIDYASSDETGYSAALTGLDPADQFTTLTSGSTDLRLKSGSALEDAGSGIAGVTTDVEGQARDPSAPDIGGDERVPADTLTVHKYPSALRDNLPLSGQYDFSTAKIQIPTGTTAPAIQSEAVDGYTTVLDGQLLYVPNSGVLIVSSGAGVWIGFNT